MTGVREGGDEGWRAVVALFGFVRRLARVEIGFLRVKMGFRWLRLEIRERGDGRRPEKGRGGFVLRFFERMRPFCAMVCQGVRETPIAGLGLAR
jgi:hypothetical protein